MTNIQKEIWKDVVGYEGLYQVSNFGQVKSVDKYLPHGRNKSSLRKGRILKPQPFKKTGYLGIDLCNVYKKRSSIHRIVAKAFIPNPENKPQVNHKNGIKTDNRVENLEWATRSENQKHSFVIGVHLPTSGEKHGLARLNEGQVIEIRNSNEDFKLLASRYCVSVATIYDIKSRRSWFHI